MNYASPSPDVADGKARDTAFPERQIPPEELETKSDGASAGAGEGSGPDQSPVQDGNVPIPIDRPDAANRRGRHRRRKDGNDGRGLSRDGRIAIVICVACAVACIAATVATGIVCDDTQRQIDALDDKIVTLQRQLATSGGADAVGGDTTGGDSNGGSTGDSGSRSDVDPDIDSNNGSLAGAGGLVQATTDVVKPGLEAASKLADLQNSYKNGTDIQSIADAIDPLLASDSKEARVPWFGTKLVDGVSGRWVAGTYAVNAGDGTIALTWLFLRDGDDVPLAWTTATYDGHVIGSVERGVTPEGQKDMPSDSVASE